MSEENKYMDDRFREMSEELKANYDQSFWEEAKRKLEDDSLDNAFQKAAADNAFVIPNLDEAKSDLEDAFLDDAFKHSADQVNVNYQPEYWDSFNQERADVEMDEAYQDAAKKLKASYNPVYWGDADLALQEEGLHYEYQSQYWEEARNLLDKADRKRFFARWYAVAGVLVLFSFLSWGVFNQFTNELNRKVTAENKESRMPANERFTHVLNGNPQNIESSELANTVPLNEAVASIEESNESELNNTELSNDVALKNTNSENQALSFISTTGTDNTVAVNNEVKPEQSSKGTKRNLESLEEVKSNEDMALVNDMATKNHSAYELTPEDLRALSHLNKIPVNLEKLSLNENKSKRLIPINQVKLPFAEHTFSVYGLAGAGLSHGGNQNVSSRYAAGINYRLQPLKQQKWSVGLGGGVQLANHNGFTEEKYITYYDDFGGAQRYWRKVDVSSLYYGKVQMNLGYCINPKNELSIGVSYAHLLSVETHLNYRNNPDLGQQNIDHNWGIKNGIAQSDIQFNLGYDFKLNNRVSLAARANVGVFDQSNNVFFSKERFDNEMNVMLGVKYALFNGLK